MLVSFVFKQSEKKRSLFRRGGIAQLAEQSPFKRLVQGSSPCAPTLRQVFDRELRPNRLRVKL